MKILNVVGARPNFMKVAPIHRALQKRTGFDSLIVHTGQHYDERMSEVFFKQLEMPEPHIYLGVGSGTHAEQTARVMTAFEQVVLKEAPNLVLVVGDVNSTLACSIVAAKCHVRVAHVEAGLRSGDRSMPEEINRVVTDAISDYLFVTEQSGLDNLRAEGVDGKKVYFVGNVMIDSLLRFREKASGMTIAENMGLEEGQYVLMTMHRPSNVDNEEGLRELVHTIERIATDYPVVFPVHPRTRARLEAFGFLRRLDHVGKLHLLDPLGYLEFLKLMEAAGIVVTDSGGIQEETTYLRIPCLTLRPNTERPSTITLGTNRLLSLRAAEVDAAVRQIFARPEQANGQIPPLWDGRAAERIVDRLADSFTPAAR